MTTDELVALYSSTESVPPIPILGELEKLDWSAVHDAYGAADKIPALLRALASCEPVHQDVALQALFEHIWHQGTIYSATATALPILFGLLDSSGPQNKSAIALLLASIADGRPPFYRCESDSKEEEKWRQILCSQNRSLDAEMAEGRQYSAEIHETISESFDLIYPFLRDPNAEVRHSIAVAIGNFPEIIPRVLPDLEEALANEPEDFVRTALRAITEPGTTS